MIHPEDIMEQFMKVGKVQQEAITALLRSGDAGFTLVVVTDRKANHYEGVSQANLDDVNVIVPAILTKFKQIYGDAWLKSVCEWINETIIS